MEIQSFKKQFESGEKVRVENAKKLYEKYILRIDKDHAIDKELRDSVTPEHVSNPTSHLFDNIEQWLVELIFINSFPRFLMHNLYQQYLRKIQELRLESTGAPPQVIRIYVVGVNVQDVSALIFEQMTVEFFAATFNLPREDLVACMYPFNPPLTFPQTAHVLIGKI